MLQITEENMRRVDRSKRDRVEHAEIGGVIVKGQTEATQVLIHVHWRHLRDAVHR